MASPGADLENSLVTELSRRANGWQPPPALASINDLASFTRAKVEPAERVTLAADLRDGFGTGDARVEPGEVAVTVRSATKRRNGWKVILEACAPPKRQRRATLSMPSTAKMESDQ